MTKRHDVGSSWISKIRRGGTALAAIGLLGSLGVAASGCDTVALISFSERSFTNIHSSGFTAPPSSCGGIESGDGEMRLRFVVTDDENRPIRLGEAVDNQSVELTPDSVELSNSALMQPDELVANCADSTCDTANGFTCGTAPGLGSSGAGLNLDRCMKVEQGLSIISEPGAVQFVADNDEHQVYGLLIENAGSLDGFIPPGTKKHWDKNGNGVTGDSEDQGVPDFRIRETATDYGGRRNNAALGAYTSWERAYKLARGDRRDTFFGLWSFESSETQPTSYIEAAHSSGLEWSKEKGTIENAIIREYSEVTPARDQRGNVYESIKMLIDNQYNDSKMSELVSTGGESMDKQLVVLVDGYDEMRENDGVELNDVITSAKEQGVRVFIVHLDPKIEEPELIREDPMYPEGQDPCADSSECKNYEECRQPRGYTENAGETVESPGTYSMDETYCLPKRDEFGRTGPIHDYSRIACETGGGYIYVGSPETLASNVEWTPYALDGLWEARVTSSEIVRGKVPLGEALRVHTDMSVSVAGETRTYSFSQIGNLEAGGDSNADDFDNRGVIFTSE